MSLSRRFLFDATRPDYDAGHDPQGAETYSINTRLPMKSGATRSRNLSTRAVGFEFAESSRVACAGGRVGATSSKEDVPAIVRGLLELGRTLELETLAEGIESDAQLDQLRGQHCEFGQGYLFARPLTADMAEQLLEWIATSLR